MKQFVKILRLAAVLAGMIALLAGMTAFASDDNSLADLGIATEGVTVTPDFSYDTWTYDVTVPAGTTELALSPTPSSSVATIANVSGTTLNEDGTGTVLITVQAQSGAQFTYTLNVTSAGEAPAPAAEAPVPATEAQPVTEAPAPVTEAPTEVQTEDSRFVRVDKNTIQEAENTITNLKADIAKYRDTVSLYTKIMYGLIAVSVLLLFIVINLILRKRDLKAELNDYRSLSSKKSKGQNQQRGGAPRPQGQQMQGGRGNAPAGTGPQGQNRPGGQGNAGITQGYSGQGLPAGGPQGQVSGQMRGGQVQYRAAGGALDVRPQTSSHRKLPEYQKEGVAAGQGKAPAAAPANAPAGNASQATAGGQGGSGAGDPAVSQGASPAGTPQTAGAAGNAGGAAETGNTGKAAPQQPGASGAGAGSKVEVDMIEL